GIAEDVRAHEGRAVGTAISRSRTAERVQDVLCEIDLQLFNHQIRIVAVGVVMPKRTHYAESVLFIETDGSAIGYVNLEIVPFDPVIRQNGLGAFEKLSAITTSAMFQ